jgi:hypothetical protein
MNRVIVVKRFEELERELAQVEATRAFKNSVRAPGVYVDGDALLKWKTKAENLLEQTAGRESSHYKNFERAGMGNDRRVKLDTVDKIKAVFLAAKEDCEGGWLVSVRSLVQAEVFDTELEQAEELLASGYVVAAAVIAGTVLETALRFHCNVQGLPPGKLDKMNADLAKAGLYDKNVQKQITALAAIRNSAAHGKGESLKREDVESMIGHVRRFLTDYPAK